MLTPDTDLGLGLLFECLMRPTFPAEAFERMKDQQLSAHRRRRRRNPTARRREAFNALVYGKHPFGRPVTRHARDRREADRRRLQGVPRDSRSRRTSPPWCVVGDFKTDEMVKKIEALTKDWKKSDAAKPAVPAPPKPTAVTEKIISDPNAAQVHVYIGHLGITRNNPDYYKLLVMDNVLGTGPGFTDRLSATLRDRQGLAYTVSATIASSAGLEPGTFTGYIGTFPDKFLDVRHGFLRRDQPDPRRGADEAGSRGREEVPARQPAVPVHDTWAPSRGSYWRPSGTGWASTSWRSTRRKSRR